MKILHLLSNYRWTERAEPAVLLAWAEARAGHTVAFACGAASDPLRNSIAPQLAARGLDHFELELPKHLRLRPLLHDARRLREYLGSGGAEILHCHMVNAHTTAALALRGLRPRPTVIRMCYEPEGILDTLRERWLLRHATDGLIVITEDARAAANACHPRLCVAVIEPGIDLDRFSPDRTLGCAAEPTEFPAGAFVVGMVSRLREARRIDLVIRAIGALARECPGLHLMVVGRGGSPQKVHDAVTRPARDAGCEDRVHLVGYRSDDALVAAYRRMDVLAYPEPGTDRSCRTVREAMAAGLPVIAANVGYLPQLVEHESTGYLAEQGVDAFAQALRSLYGDRALLRRFAANGLGSARNRFGLDRQAQQTQAFYEQCRK